MPDQLKRFIVIDQTLSSLVGHHHEYSTSVAVAARDAGFETYIFCHKSMKDLPSKEGIKIIPWFSHQWTGAKKINYNIFGRNFIRYVYYKLVNLASLIIQPFLPLYLICHQNNFFPWPIHNLRDYLIGLAAKSKLLKGRQFKLEDMFYGSVDSPELRLVFYNEIGQLLKNYSFGENDQILIHTIGTAQLEGLQDYLLTQNLSSLPYFHVLLRRRLEEELGWHPDGLTIRGVVQRFALSNLWPYKLSFYTDSEGLTRQYNSISNIRFLTAPIPFQMPDLPTRTNYGSPLTITYLGDARYEKGFHELPNAVHSMWQGYVETGKVCFELQANHDDHGTDQLIINAVEKLSLLPEKNVKLLRQPLSEEDYYRLLAQSDIVVLPYNAKLYGDRSSGVLSQALAAGKVVVVPNDTWMAEQITSERGVAYNESAGLSQAIKLAVDRFPSMAHNASDYSEIWRYKHTPKKLFALLNEQFVLAQKQNPPSKNLLYFFESYILEESGGTQVHRAQIQYFISRGYSIYAVMLCNEFMDKAQQKKYLERIKGRSLKFNFTYLWILFPKASLSKYSGVVDYAIACRMYGAFFASTEGMRISGIPKTLVDWRAFSRCEFLWVNYAKNHGIIDLLRLKDMPRICETLDIISLQNFSMAGFTKNGFKQELMTFQEFSDIVTLSYEDKNTISKHLLNTRTHYLPPFVPSQALEHNLLLGHTTLHNFLASAGCEYSVPEYFKNSLASIDVLFVGSGHIPNYDGIWWFYNNVFIPFLQKKGFNLVIAGSVCHGLGDFRPNPQVHLLGTVRNLDPLYAAAKIVITPLLDGTGISIKTIEAVLVGKPLVSTSVGIRGIKNSESLAVANTPFDFKEKIEKLLTSVESRKEAAEKAWIPISRLHSWSAYQKNFDAILSIALGKEITRQAPTNNQEFVFLEASPFHFQLNQALDSYIKGEELPDLSPLLKALQTPHIKPSLEKLYQANMDLHFNGAKSSSFTSAELPSTLIDWLNQVASSTYKLRSVHV